MSFISACVAFLHARCVPRTTLALLSAVVSTAHPLAGAVSAVGGEFAVNTDTLATQSDTAIAMSNDGGFVVVWASSGYDFSIFARVFDPSGVPETPEFEVATYTAFSRKYHPSLAINDDGDMIVAWSAFGQDGESYSVFARRFDSSGVPIAAEFQVNSYTPGGQSNPAVGIASGGDFVVAWQRSFDYPTVYDIFAARFDADAVRLATEFRVNGSRTGHQLYPSVAMRATGEFIVTWQSERENDAPNGFEVVARRFNSVGSPQAQDFQVNTYSIGDQWYPAAAIKDDGDFVVAWESFHPYVGIRHVFLRQFDDTGSPQASEFEVSSYTIGGARPSTTMDEDGDFVVAWSSLIGPRTRAFDRSGVPTSPELQVNTYSGLDRYPVVAMNDGGFFAVAFEGQRFPGSKDIFARRFVATPTLDVDGDGAAEPLTDGILILRWLFGFTGAGLVSAAVDPAECTRCSTAEIEAYLASIESELDIDGSGSLAPLTDGLLVVRRLFGLNGANLTAGAVDGGACTRCTAQAIVQYVASLG